MKFNKTITGLALLVIASATLAATAKKKPSQPGSDPTTPPTPEQQAQQDRDYRTGEAITSLVNIFRDISLVYVDTINPQKALNTAAGAMLGELDPYTEYLPASEMEDFETSTTGKYAGIGAAISRSSADTSWVEISEPYQGNPADIAGLKAGDRILAIDGQSMRGKNVEQVSALLRGNPGTKFDLTILPVKALAERDTSALRQQTLTLTRQRITIPAVSYSGFVNDSTGYIRLDNFTEKCSDEVRAALEDLKRSGRMHGLILDLRGNGGGILGEAVKIVSLFVPRGTTVVSVRGRSATTSSSYRTASDPLDTVTPLVVLVNNSSASASEIVAGALQDLDRAVIAGQRSYGKGLVQSTLPVGNGGFLKVTTARYYTPSGRCIQALDYSHRASDGSAEHIPDSLIREFHTAAGRKVYDGGGITPDLTLEPQYLSRFATILLSYGYVDDFANLYVAKHPAPIAMKDFSIDDTAYAAFCRFIESKNIPYTSVTELRFAELKRAAEQEKTIDQIDGELDAIAAAIKNSRQTELARFDEELRRNIAVKIAVRWWYSHGAIEYMVGNDPEISTTAQVLSNRPQYQSYLTVEASAPPINQVP